MTRPNQSQRGERREAGTTVAMTRRGLLRQTGAAGAVAALAPLMGCAKAASVPPNVLLIAIDDLNDWVGALGGHPNAKTPNIDRLAARGTLFTNAHANAPICGPSRTSLMSGLMPATTGVYGHIDDEDIRQASPRLAQIDFLPQHFERGGYRTMGIGKLFHQGAPDGAFEEFGGRYEGFGPSPDEAFVWDEDGTSTDWGAFPQTDEEMPDTQSAAWTAQRLGRRYDRPFFLGCGFLRPHVPWYVPQKWFDLHPLEDIVLPPHLEGDLDDTPTRARLITNLPNMPRAEWAKAAGQWPAIVQAYLACISFVDHCVGTVLDALEASEHRDNTVVTLFSDHGYHIGEKGLFQKFTLWERATRIPLIMAGPGVPEGRLVATPASLVDLYPTLSGLAGLAPPKTAEGRDLSAAIRDETPDAVEGVLTTYGIGNHAVRTDRYRFIRYADGTTELYDHTNDPNEWTNLSGRPEHAATERSLLAMLPLQNAAWSDQSYLNIAPYFRDPKNKALR